MQLTCKTSFPGILTAGKTYEAEYFNEDQLRITDDTGKPMQARWCDFEPARKPFKKGDKLTCLRRKAYQALSAGDTYEAESDELHGRVSVTDDVGGESSYEVSQFEHAESRPEPLGARCAHDPVNRPAHYTDGKIEVIDFIEDKKLGYHLGNAIKYIARAGKKDPAKVKEDLEKAIWYIKRHIQCVTDQ